MKKLSLAICCILFIIGCSNSDNEESLEQPNSTFIQSKQNISFQKDTLSDKVASYFKNRQNKVSDYKAIYAKEQLFIAFNATTLNQPIEQDLEKEMANDLKKLTNVKDLYVTSDQKFYIELTKLEDQSLTESEMNKKIEEFKKLKEEQT